jgi:hypothetical protein
MTTRKANATAKANAAADSSTALRNANKRDAVK